MTTTAVVQARAGSTRLPGKVLQPLAGRPLLAFMLARLEGLPVDVLVVATSTHPRDDEVAKVAADAGVAVVRGSESDVLARFVDALDAYPADTVVRLTADCPLADPALVGQVLALHAQSGADYTSNTLVRTYPDGLDVEVISAVALKAAADEATDPPEREHVTPFVYRRPERFKLVSELGPELLGGERWTVDTFEDLERIRSIVAKLPNPLRAGWQDVLAAAGRLAPPPAVGALTLRPDGRADPSVRSWVAEVDGRAVGRAQVSVRSGTGRLQRSIEAGRDEELLALVRKALSADFQVRELIDE